MRLLALAVAVYRSIVGILFLDCGVFSLVEALRGRGRGYACNALHIADCGGRTGLSIGADVLDASVLHVYFPEPRFSEALHGVVQRAQQRRYGTNSRTRLLS